MSGLNFTINANGRNRASKAAVPQAPQNVAAEFDGDDLVVTWSAAGMQIDDGGTIAAAGSGYTINVQAVNI